MIVVSNRAIEEHEPPQGGLSTALRATLEASGGHWFCIVPDKNSAEFHRTEKKWKDTNVAVQTIHVPADLYEKYYAYANKLAWTINHDRPDLARFTPDEQRAYGIVLDKVADIIADFIDGKKLRNDPAWIHDFHLGGLGQRLKDRFERRGMVNKLLFHLHTPIAGMRSREMTSREEFVETGLTFKKSDLVQAFKRAVQPERTLDWLMRIKPAAHTAYINFLKDMTYFDSVSLQTGNDCKSLLKALKIRPMTGSEFPRFVGRSIGYEGRTFTLMNAPISIASRKILQNIFSKLHPSRKDSIQQKWDQIQGHLSPEARELLNQISDNVEYIEYTGAERGDFSKGIEKRARQYYKALQDNPDWRGRVQLLQVMIPTRGNIDGGENEYTAVEKEANYWFEKANEDFATAEWTPVVLRTEKVTNDDAILLGRAIRFLNGKLRHTICKAGAIRDGMNLTVEEGAIGQDDDYPGLTVVPQSIGAAQELGPLTMTYDPERDDAFTDTMKRAMRLYARKDALDVLRGMHKDMKNFLIQNDLTNWAANCLRTVAPLYADRLLAATRNDAAINTSDGKVVRFTPQVT